jgi:BlaI family penicillinase repressor
LTDNYTLTDPFAMGINDDHEQLTRRERQIMNILYRLGDATVADVIGELPDDLSRNAVRTFLTILERKGHTTHKESGRSHVFRPIKKRRRAGQAAVQNVIHTFFGGSLEEALAVHLANPKSDVSQEELKRIEQLIRDARKKEE